ncbi:CU044_5270 family protein [Curtobacterium sp. Leaf261]|uniref:CU044_5270 family protein n=1 Tax=Curtobacterium sp. Leaf261 TaxID=1736311 RepID=UPI0006FEDC3A|nr:CU044_5270 family protein [Curtobacterium sp. Leaf261]KQO64238.1 hypothetical protein ASF23_16880 [Curtobacterium sp. Leaf261]
MPDDLATVRRLRSEVDALPPEVIDATLARVRQRLDAPVEPPRAPAPRRRLRPVVLGIASAAAAAALVATGLGLTHLTSPESAAAATLHDAARASMSSAEPANAFTKVTTRERALGYATSDGEHYDEAYVADDVSITWVPRSISRTWTRVSWSEPASTFYGGAAAHDAARRDYATEAHRDTPNHERAAGGDFTNGELGGTPAGTLTPADIPGLPRDPGALVRRIEAAPKSVGDTDTEHVFDTVAEMLRTGLVPADLRVGMYDALATLPGITVTERQASLDGRTGTAIGLADPSGSEQRQVIIDRSSGDYLGERMLQLERNGSIPAGTVMDSVSVVSMQVSTADDR